MTSSCLKPTTMWMRLSGKAAESASCCCFRIERPSRSGVRGFGRGRPSRTPRPAARITIEGGFIATCSRSDDAGADLNAVGPLGRDQGVATGHELVDGLEEAPRALARLELAEVEATRFLAGGSVWIVGEACVEG